MGSFRLGASARAPWDDGGSERGWIFARLWASGPDTTLDRVLRLHALRSNERGEVDEFDRACGEDEASAAELFASFRRFAGERALLVGDGETFRTWLEHHPASGDGPVLGLAEAAALLLPGRTAPARGLDTAVDLRRAFEILVARFLALRGASLAVLAPSFAWTWSSLAESDPLAAERVALCLSLAERPSRWCSTAGASELGLCDGGLSDALRGDPRDGAELARRRIDLAAPACFRARDAWLALDTVPVDTRAAAPFDPADLERLDLIFERHLPALFDATDAGGAYRAGQHQVAREIARTLGERELLLVHAPTGTGKTIAYLVPALLWSQRHGVRIGVSTYTRALQEQAMEHDVPRALEALARAGLASAPRVSALKGRANYLCWRALRLHVPAEDDGPEDWLAWTLLCAFALTDEHGDLDRLPLRLPLGGARAQRAIEALASAVRAHSGCCTLREDRETCAAEFARERAEKSHLVVTNHAFTLARQGFFKRVVFDECEHLHEQAHAAWSHTLPVREVRESFARLREPRRPTSRAPLDRLERIVLDGGPAHATLRECGELQRSALDAVERLERALAGFKSWRDEVRREREEKDEHALLREFVLLSASEERARELVAARDGLHGSAVELETALARLSTELEPLPAQGLPRLRRALERARADLAEKVAALEAWIPTRDGTPVFNRETFYDVEQDARGEDALAARVLLPNEVLGRHYYPQLSCAVLLSATTWLRSGFESAAGYLGLDRAAFPAQDEEREPSRVRTFRAPDPFDYTRVLVCIPRDAPAYAAGREAFLAYVRRFVAFLGERTRGRMLVLFTNSEDLRKTGEELAGFFRARRIPFWFQGMSGVRKEELSELFRARVDSVLLGVDTFWYGADFPGETLEYLVIVKLPYGVPDRYHHAQCAALGTPEQRRRIYLPRALGKFRQGFGRLMRRESDRGCVFVLDGRIAHGAHRAFLAELPLAARAGDDGELRGARLVEADTERCVAAALEHMGVLADLPRLGLDLEFDAPERLRELPPDGVRERPTAVQMAPAPRPLARESELLDVPLEDLPF